MFSKCTYSCGNKYTTLIYIRVCMLYHEQPTVSHTYVRKSTYGIFKERKEKVGSIFPLFNVALSNCVA